MAVTIIRQAGNDTIGFPYGTPEEVMQRAIAEHIAEQKAVEADNADDSLLERGGKYAGAALRGTAQGVVGDLEALGVALPQWLYEVGKKAVKGRQGEYYERQPVEWPVSKAFEEHMPAAPKGYETTNDVAAFAGPAVVETLASGGFGAPGAIVRGASLGARAKAVGGAALRGGIRSGTTVGADWAGSEAGGKLGELIAGDIGRELGSVAGGGATPGVVTPLRKSSVKKAYMDPDAPLTVEAVKRINDYLRSKSIPEKDLIPLSVGLVGTKSVGTLEDTMARGAFAGAPVLENRRAQYAGVDRAAQNLMQDVRGGPSGGPITKESIGFTLEHLINDTQRTIEDRVTDLQETLARRVGPGTEIDPAMIEDTFNDLINDREMDAELQDQARQLRDAFRANYAQRQGPAATGAPLPPDPPTYGATKDYRTRRGKKLGPGVSIAAKVDAPLYESLTNTMRDTAAQQGVPRAEFDQTQAETRRLNTQLETQVEPTQGRRKESGTYNAVFGDSSVRQLEPFLEHQPGATGRAMADALELDIRGSNAGRPVDPELVEIKRMQRGWGDRGPEFQQTYVPDPTTRSRMDDLNRITQAEAARGGKRSTPTGGNTIGETQFGDLSLLRMGAGGFLGGPLGAILSAGVIPIAKRVIGRQFTNPMQVQRLFENNTKANISRGLVGATSPPLQEDDKYIPSPRRSPEEQFTVAPDQSGVQPGYVRIIGSEGNEQLVEEGLLEPVE